MKTHVMEAVRVFLLVLLVGIPWRIIAMKMSDTSLGKAMAVAY